MARFPFTALGGGVASREWPAKRGRRLGEGTLMGSGSGGGGGGGTGGATAGGGRGYGGYKISGGRLIVQDVDASKKAKALSGVLKKLPPEYLQEQFIDSSAREVYR